MDGLRIVSEAQSGSAPRKDWSEKTKMAVNEHRLCMGCMSVRNEEGRCKQCGYDPSAPANINFIQPGSRLNEKYIVGKLVSSDPEGAWYVGYDCEKETRVWVREYVPASITRRDHRDFSVQPLASSEAQYKALMSDFEDLCGSVMKLSESSHVLPIEELVHANHTVYAIYRYLKTITLESFLVRSGGKLSWRYAKKLLMPLYHSVVNLHKLGLIHRGLSSQTIQLDQSGTLWISGFSIAAARTNKSEISAQLFPGYSAPEQYSLNSWQGTWTDVYALGAITYRTITGQTPPAALDRIYGDDLLDKQIISSDITENIVETINRALAVEVEDRIQTVEAFIASLLATEGSNTAVYASPAPHRKMEGPDILHNQQVAYQKVPANRGGQSETYQGGIELMPSPAMEYEMKDHVKASGSTGKKQKKKRTHPVLSLILSLFVATSLLAGIMYWIANTYLSDLIQPASASSSSESSRTNTGEDYVDDGDEDSTLIPKLVGKTADSIKGNTNLAERFQLEYVEKFNSDYEKGVVFDQQPVEGTPIEGIDKITLYVSKGVEQVELPDLVDLPIEEATATLTELELQFTVIPVFNNDYEPGVIISTDPVAGTMVDKNNGTVLLKIKKELLEDDKQEEEDPGDGPSKSNKSSKSSKSSSKSKSKDTESRLIHSKNN